jgi:thioredoxin reductase
MEIFDVTVIGGGPAGLAAATSSSHNGAKTLLIEREAKLGGILKQCIHDGFGLARFQTKLSGPEYANKEIHFLNETSVTVKVLTFVSSIKKINDLFHLSLVSREGINEIFSKKLVLATGCRERTSRQVFI